MPEVGGHEVHSPKPCAPESSADVILRAHTAFTPRAPWDGSAFMPMLSPNRPHVAHLLKLPCSTSTWVFPLSWVF